MFYRIYVRSFTYSRRQVNRIWLTSADRIQTGLGRAPSCRDPRFGTVADQPL